MQIVDLMTHADASSLYNKVLSRSFVDGKATAQADAKRIKSNKQLDFLDKANADLLHILTEKLQNNLVVSCYTFPRAMPAVMANCYEKGDHYDWHVDHSLIRQHRSDLSFTLFLTDPASYAGGELELDYRTHTARVKGKPGQMVIYPTGVRHRVTEITSGRRVSVVGWITSLIPREEDRIMLLNFYRDLSTLSNDENGTLARLNEFYHFVVRRLTVS